MPLWLWQEVQALPWSTEIVALTCGIQNCLRPPSSLLKRPRQACCATPAQDQKCWNAAAFEQSQFFDHTGSSEKTLKKLKGAALTLPFASRVVTSAIGRGTTTPHSNLYRSCGSSSRKEMPDI